MDSKRPNAFLYRILHHATVINIVGDSYRIKNHLEREKENE
ncbi:ATP-binding protein [Geobacillus thermodenitrificans]|nr:ATP-binding protein [Geobacillus thermodenitrificans]MED4919489.1 ATP-binding protein [Geobacillus thermodenitrificans]